MRHAISGLIMLRESFISNDAQASRDQHNPRAAPAQAASAAGMSPTEIALWRAHAAEALATQRADALQQSLQQAHRLARIGNWYWEARTATLHLMPEACALLGLPTETRALSLAECMAWVVPEQRRQLARWFSALTRGGQPLETDLGVTRPRGDNAYFTFRAEPSASRVESDRFDVYGSIQDETDRVAHTRQTERLAYIDALTGLVNRARVAEIVDGWLDASVRLHTDPTTGVAALVLNLGRFRHINETLGHGTGDAFIQAFGRRVRESVGLSYRPDGVSARCVVACLGGDTFAVLLRDVTEADAQQCAASIHFALAGIAWQPSALNIPIEAAIGIACSPRHGASASALLMNASLAMSHAKHSSRSGVELYAPALSDRLRKRDQMEAELRLEETRRQFFFEFQPVIDTSTGRMVSCEALLRWRKPDGTLVSPGIFIPLAESTGLIVQIGQWAITTFVQQLSRWRAQGCMAVPVAINFSALQLRDMQTADHLCQALVEAGIPPERVHVEITETAMMHDMGVVESVLQRLRQFGIQLSVDDFGTGYSSLSNLRRLPIDTLKVDRSFVAEIETSSESRAIVEAIVTMARALKLDVIAEGVETIGQGDQLKALGCMLQQGNVLSPPISAEAILARSSA
jgi:diguanylate cyclase (GGDEF)-like protein